MKRAFSTTSAVAEAKRRMQRVWFTWGVGPLGMAAVLMLIGSEVSASPADVDEHTLERGFQAVFAVCASLFLTGFWLDGRWTNSERIATRIWQAAGGEKFVPTRSQLAANAEIAFRSITTSARMLTAIGGAIAVSAVISVWAGLGIGEGIQLILLGLAYQVFVLSRHPYYSEIMTAAVQGELVVAEEHGDAN